jgi:type IV pilus assembly protein PilM
MSTGTRGRGARGWLASEPPTTAVEVGPDGVTAVTVVSTADGAAVSGFATAPLAPGVVTPALNATNVADRDALAAAVRSAVDALTPRPRRVALVLPDTVGKVSIVRFDQVPARAADLEQLIRWQVKKAAPYRVEDAQLSWIPGVAVPGGGQEFVVTTARRDVIAEYERACDAAGLHAGLVDLATFNLINTAIATAPAGAAGDWLLVHVAHDYVTLAVLRGADLVFFRNRAGADSDELVELVHQTTMYHEDRLGGGGFSRVVVAGAALHAADASGQVQRAIHDRLGAPIEPLEFRGPVTLRDRIAPGPGVVDRLGPAVGVLLRERVA